MRNIFSSLYRRDNSPNAGSIELQKPLYRFFERAEIIVGMTFSGAWFYSAYLTQINQSPSSHVLYWLIFGAAGLAFIVKEKDRAYNNQTTWSERVYNALDYPSTAFIEKPIAPKTVDEQNLDAAIVLAYLQSSNFDTKEQEIIKSIMAKNKPHLTNNATLMKSDTKELAQNVNMQNSLDSQSATKPYKKYLYQK